VYVIGYPLGGVLSISLQDSVWLDADDTFLHYRTPTEPGSSGSPVFDQKYWTPIGVHHRGKINTPRLHGLPGTYEANEAITISEIRKVLRESGKG
jgi:V8-like Glu-specific endopeptidase